MLTRPARRFALLLLALPLAVVTNSCGSADPPAESFAAPGAACKASLAAQCGGECSDDAQCGAGLYCNLGGHCSADCGAGVVCPAGTTCDAHGQCAADPNAFDAGGGGEGGACPRLQVEFAKVVPTVVVLVDQSGSMTEDFGGDTRWNVARKALVDPTNGVIKLLENDVRFGLALYTSKDGSAGGTCPLLRKVNVATGNFAAIKQMYDAAKPEGETPTGESVEAIANELSDPKIPGPKFIVLATDGEPDTCAVPNPQTGQKPAVDATKAAFAKGIKTYYVSVGNDVTGAHAQEMANAGQGIANAKYYRANDAATLRKAFDEIIYGVRSCTFKVAGRITDPKKGQVSLDGTPLVYADANGWSVSADGTTVELMGDACTKIKTGDHKLDALFECGAVIK